MSQPYSSHQCCYWFSISMANTKNKMKTEEKRNKYLLVQYQKVLYPYTYMMIQILVYTHDPHFRLYYIVCAKNIRLRVSSKKKVYGVYWYFYYLLYMVMLYICICWGCIIKLYVTDFFSDHFFLMVFIYIEKFLFFSRKTKKKKKTLAKSSLPLVTTILIIKT